MAQLLFDALTGVSTIDNQPVISVQSLLDVQSNAAIEEVTAADDDDVFQCGKCKKQFTSLPVFMSHKKEACGNLAKNITISDSQNALVVQKIQQVPKTPVTTFASGVMLNESDVLTLSSNIDESLAAASHHHCIQALTSDSTLPSAEVTDNGSTFVNVVQQLGCSRNQKNGQPDPNQLAHTVGLSLLSNSLVSTPILVASQPNSINSTTTSIATIPNIVVSIDSPVLSKSPYSQSDVDSSVVLSKANNGIADPIIIATHNIVLDTPKPNPPPKDISTVNIITEFHSSMVRSRKKSTNQEKSDLTQKDSKLKCAYCEKTFTKNFDLQQHIRCHTGEKPFQCIVCGRAFAQKSNVKKHMQTHKVWPNGLAHTLPKITGSQQEQQLNDLKLNLEEPDANCLTEDQLLENETPPDQENGIATSNYACSYCEYTGKTYFQLKTHMKQHKKEKVYKCILNTCGQMFHDLDLFLCHTKVHESDMEYRCHQCNKTFQSLYELGAHQYTHSLYPNQGSRTAPRYFQCSKCLNKYSTPAALNHHMATSPHNYVCPFCDKSFPCERYLRRHLHTHRSSNRYICNVCGKGFKTEHYLKVHMLIHSGEKPFTCSQCHTSFNRQDKLKRHYLIHEPVKRLKCPFRTHTGCPKEFNRPDKLKAHILTHSCIKPFNCKLCGRNFTRKAHLREHERLHDKVPSAQSEWDKSQQNSLQGEQCIESISKKHPREQRNYKINRIRNKSSLNFENSYNRPKRRGRPKKSQEPKSSLIEIPENTGIEMNSDLDDIPTAHIEIISDLTNGDVSHITLTGDINISGVQFCPIVTENVSDELSKTVSSDQISELIPVSNAILEENIDHSSTIEFEKFHVT